MGCAHPRDDARPTVAPDSVERDASGERLCAAFAPPSERPEVLVGRLIAHRYRVTQVIDCGGAGFVYAADDVIEGEAVALKVMRPSTSSDASMRARFRNETSAVMAIVNPHIVEIFGFGELEDGTPYYAMELLDGRSLADVLEPPIAEVIRIGRQLCSGLAAAHARGIIHRDLKPENVLLSGDDDQPAYKLVDFGIAKIPTARDLTVPGAVFGTPGFMAPEQAKPNAAVDHRADIYALGVILYELVTGTVPFDSDDAMQVILATIGKPPTPVRELAPHCPEPLERVIMRCLMKLPEMRYQDVRELDAALAAVADEDSPLIDVDDVWEEPSHDNSQTIIFDSSSSRFSIDELVPELDPELEPTQHRVPTPPPPEPWARPTMRAWWPLALLLFTLAAAATYLVAR